MTARSGAFAALLSVVAAGRPELPEEVLEVGLDRLRFLVRQG